MFKINRVSWVMALAIALGLVAVVPAFAAGGPGGGNGLHGGPKMMPGVFGTASSVSGNTLMVAAKTRSDSATTSTAYTVDATNAKVMKNGTSSTVASIAAGDTVMV